MTLVLIWLQKEKVRPPLLFLATYVKVRVCGIRCVQVLSGLCAMPVVGGQTSKNKRNNIDDILSFRHTPPLTNIQVLEAQEGTHLGALEAPPQLPVVILQGRVKERSQGELRQPAGSKLLLDEIRQTYLPAQDNSAGAEAGVPEAAECQGMERHNALCYWWYNVLYRKIV